MFTAELQQQLDEQRPSAIQPQAKALLSQLQSEGLPTRKDEAWRYTSLSLLENHPWRLCHVSKTHQLVLEEIRGQDRDISSLCVFLNGTYQHEKSTNISKVAFHSLTENNLDQSNFVSRFNLATLTNGYQLRVPKGLDAGIIECIHLTSCSEDALISSRLQVVLEENARLTLIHHYLSDQEVTYLNSHVVEYQLAAGSNCDVVKIQEEGSRAIHLAHAQVTQAKGSHFQQHQFSLGARLSRDDVNVSVGSGEVDLYGLYLLSDEQHVDHHLMANHDGHHGRSRQHYRGILADASVCVFNGAAVVQADASKNHAEQHNHTLLLSKKARINTKPELEIYHDDVSCSHGATVGQLDKEALFYLISRGIGQRQAEFLLQEAFIKDIIQTVPAAARAIVTQKVMAKMQALRGS